MSEQPSGKSPESIPKEVQSYLAFATGELLKAGISACLKYDVDRTNKFIQDMGEELSPEDQAWHRSLADRTFKAELPLFIHKNEHDSGETSYWANKIDNRGHVFMGHGISLFSLNSDGTQSLSAFGASDDIEVSQNLIDTVQAVAQKYEELGWQPTSDLGDVPPSAQAA